MGDVQENRSAQAIISGNMYPWRLADWVEEVLDISNRLHASFHHILREANVIADGFTKEGLTRVSIFFYI